MQWMLGWGGGGNGEALCSGGDGGGGGLMDDPYYKASIAPNPKVLNDLKPSKEQLEKVYGGIMKEVNDLRLQINSKKTLSCIDRQGISFNTNTAKV